MLLSAVSASGKGNPFSAGIVIATVAGLVVDAVGLGSFVVGSVDGGVLGVDAAVKKIIK